MHEDPISSSSLLHQYQSKVFYSILIILLEYIQFKSPVLLIHHEATTYD